MAQRPSEKPNWIPDDTTGITAPNGAKRAIGWILEKPPFQYFNWFFNNVSQWIDRHASQSEEWIVIDSDADEQDYATLAAYIADTPAAGDRVLIKEDQTVTVQTIVPSDITIKPLDGARLLCATNIATSVLQLGSNVIIEGVLNIVLSHTGTTAKAVEFNGDNATGKINVENSSTGTLTTGYHINASKTGNQVAGFIDNTGGGVLTNIGIDSSGEDSNNLQIVDAVNNQVWRTRGAYKFREGLEFDLGSDADGDIYYRTGGVLTRRPKGSDGDVLILASGIPVWQTNSAFYAHRNGVVQSVTASTWTKVRFTHEDWDNNNEFVNDADDSGGATESRYTPAAGKHLFVALVTIDVTSDFAAHRISLYKNGVDYRRGIEMTNSNNGDAGLLLVVEDDANGTDYFEIYVFHAEGGARNIFGVKTHTYFFSRRQLS